MNSSTIEGLQQDQAGRHNIETASETAAGASKTPTRNGDPSGPPHSPLQALPPHVKLIEMGTAFWASRVVYAAAKLGLADHLDHKPMSAVELSQLVGGHAPS